MTVDLTIRQLLPWLMSAITLWMTLLQGRKTWTAWLWGLLNQVLWLIYILYTHTWGLLPLNLGLWWLYARNLVRWYDDEAQAFVRHLERIRQQKHDYGPGALDDGER
jgi:hypothetical protein